MTMGEAVQNTPRRDASVRDVLAWLTSDHGVLEDFVAWMVEDMRPHPVAMELRRMRREVDAGTLPAAAMRKRVGELKDAAAAAAMVGINRARDPRAATMLAARKLIYRGEDAHEGATEVAKLHALHDELETPSDASPAQRAAATRAAHLRQLEWLFATIEGRDTPPPRHGERYLFGDAPFDPAAVVDALAGERLDGPPEDPPRAVIVVGGPGSGKTTHRRKVHPDLLVIDAGEVHEHLCAGVRTGFPGSALRRMTEVGHLLVRRALTARRSFVVEIIGADVEPVKRVIAALKGIGYRVELEHIHCTAEEATRRYEAMTEDRISAYYAEAHHLAWLEAVAAGCLAA
jgi:hypothetical protein